MVIGIEPSEMRNSDGVAVWQVTSISCIQKTCWQLGVSFHYNLCVEMGGGGEET